MKSNNALIVGVSQETYCRHGFHEWMEVSTSDLTCSASKANESPKSPVFKCKHCGRKK